MPDWMLQVLGIVVSGVVSGVGTYSAIRADLARLNEVASQAREAAALAHRRIDNIRFNG